MAPATSPAVQTIQDIAGIAALGGNREGADRLQVAAQDRPAARHPDALPPPGSDQTTVATPDWPKDPDARRQGAEGRGRAPREGGRGAAADQAAQAVEAKRPNRSRERRSGRPRPCRSPAESAKARKLFADARGAVAVDENGQPVRRYLTDPPSDYRVPDPNAPVEIVDEPNEEKEVQVAVAVGFASN